LLPPHCLAPVRSNAASAALLLNLEARATMGIAWHVHARLIHKHPHYPDLHHRHTHAH